MLDQLLVPPGQSPDLASRPTRDPDGAETEKERGKHELLPERRQQVARQVQRLHAEGERSLLLVLQGTDTSGKDGVIKHVFRGVSPSATRVAAFRAPSSSELAHDYLWRVHAVCPPRGEVGIFNRSHYEDVMAARVRGLVDEETWRRRYRHIREFELLLHDEGTRVVKCFLHLSKERQLERLQARLDDPEKRWKFRRDDLDDRARWDRYQESFEEAIFETSTAWAPWYVVPADRKWQRNLLVADIVTSVLDEMDPQIPEASEETAGVVLDDA